MASVRNKVIRVLLLLSMAVLPAGVVQCEFDDGELEIDFDDWDYDYDGVHVDVWYDEWYDPWPCCW